MNSHAVVEETQSAIEILMLARRCMLALKAFPLNDFKPERIEKLCASLNQLGLTEASEYLAGLVQQVIPSVARVQDFCAATMAAKLPNGNFKLSICLNDKWLEINREFTAEELGIKNEK